MKFAKGQRVTVTPLGKQGTVLMGFPVKVYPYGEPDAIHYNVHVHDYDQYGEDIVEVSEEDLT